MIEVVTKQFVNAGAKVAKREMRRDAEESGWLKRARAKVAEVSTHPTWDPQRSIPVTVSVATSPFSGERLIYSAPN
jgi:hypothetical protein